VISLSNCVAKLGVDGVKRNALAKLSNAPKNVGFR
jgi:hypothetical protein